MANVLYTKFFERIASGNLAWASATVRALLVRSTSAYAPNKDHDFLSEFTSGGGVEVSVTSYARQSIANGAVNIDDGNDRVELDCDDISFGNLESGQTVKAILIYAQVGGDDDTPEDDPLIAYIDTDAGGILPVALAGGPFTVTINAEGGLIQFSQSA